MHSELGQKPETQPPVAVNVEYEQTCEHFPKDVDASAHYASNSFEGKAEDLKPLARI